MSLVSHEHEFQEGLPPCSPVGDETKWFAVYRPTSRDAIAKMLSGRAVGKGLNVKGKSAKKNRLSGFVPFLQISQNKHKDDIEDSPPDSRIMIFYTTETARKTALSELQPLLSQEVGSELWSRQEVERHTMVSWTTQSVSIGKRQFPGQSRVLCRVASFRSVALVVLFLVSCCVVFRGASSCYHVVCHPLLRLHLNTFIPHHSCAQC